MVLAVRELHPCRGREFRLADGVVIGRAPDCGLALEDPLVSRRHARVLISALGAGIEDLDSANGVYVNGTARHRITALHPRDIVQLGGTWLQVDSISC